MKALYNTQTNAILPWPRIDEEPVVGLDAHLLEMNVTQEPQPAYDPATERIEKTEIIDVDARLVTQGWNVVAVPAPSYTAEDWITSQGYTATRLVSLLDVESKLNAAAKVSPKTTAVRGWLDTVLATYAQDPSPRGDWPACPHAYEETIQEALTILTT